MSQWSKIRQKKWKALWHHRSLSGVLLYFRPFVRQWLYSWESCSAYLAYQPGCNTVVTGSGGWVPREMSERSNEDDCCLLRPTSQVIDANWKGETRSRWSIVRFAIYPTNQLFISNLQTKGLWIRQTHCWLSPAHICFYFLTIGRPPESGYYRLL